MLLKLVKMLDICLRYFALGSSGFAAETVDVRRS